jgi:hypothetical protein
MVYPLPPLCIYGATTNVDSFFLNSDSETPAKIHFALIEASSLQGTQTSNPFGFYRRWEVEKNFGTSSVAEILNSHLADEVSQLKRFFIDYVQKQEQKTNAEQQTSSGNLKGEAPPTLSRKGKQPLRGRGRAKNLRPRPPRQSLMEDDDEEGEDGSEKSFKSFRSAHSTNEQPMTDQPSLTLKETVYVKSIELELNNDPLDQFKSECTADECTVGKN